MDHSNFLRRSKAGHSGSPAPALRAFELRVVLLLLVGAASLLTLAGATLMSRGPFGHGRHVSFIERTVGQPIAHSTPRPLVNRYVSAKTHVTLDRNGVTIQHLGNTIQLAADAAGSAPWQPRADGVLRRTPFGSEAIVTTGTRTESFLNVESRVGVRTWRWKLGDTVAQLGDNGTVRLAGGMTIRRPAIFDDNGKDVTPAGTRWSLARHGGGVELLLRLDDAGLPTPYVIDPEVDYGSGTTGVLYPKLAASTYNKGTNGVSPGLTDTLTPTSGGTICTGTTTPGATSCPGLTDTTNTNGTFWAGFVNNGPVNGLFVNATPPLPTAAAPTGIMVDNPGHANGTVIPGGTWTFTVPTYATALGTNITFHIAVGAWVVTDSSTSVISAITTTLIDPGVTAGSENTVDDLDATITPTVRTWTVGSVPQVTLASNQHILVRFYLKKSNTGNRSNGGSIYLGVNGTGTALDGVTNVTTPASIAFPHQAFEKPSVPTITSSSFIKASSGTVGATYATPGTGTSDQGHTTFYLCPTNADCSGGSPTWTGNSTSSTLTNGGAASAIVGTALTDGTTYYLEGLDEATDPFNANAAYATAVKSAVSGRTALVADGGAPTDATTLTSATGAYKSGSTIYYKGNVAGAFTLRDTVTDARSGAASATFGLLSGGTGFSAHTAETISTPAGGPYNSTAITWTSATGAPTIPVNSTDAVGNSSTATTLTLSSDTTGPTGGSISVPARVNALSVAITSGNYTTDAGGSGVAGNSITRSAGQAPTAGVCPGSGYTGATTVSSPDTGVANGLCYVYTLTGTDNVGNTSTISSSPVLVDTTAPSDAITLTSTTGAYKSGSTVYYKGNAAGSFTIRDAVTDALSGPASATFGLLSGGSGFSAHSSETVSTPVGGPYDSTAISWTAASGAPTIPVNGTDAAGNNSSATTLTLALDNTAPTAGSISVPAYATSTSVTITSGNYSDAGSGIASNTITRSNGQSPLGGVCPAVGTFTGATVVSSPDTGVVNGQCYVYTLTGTDRVGNSVSLATTNAVLVDTTAPSDAITLTAATGAFKSGSTVYYKGNAAGSFKLRNTVTDADSGPASATFGLLSGGAGFAAHNSETIGGSSPYDSTAITWAGAASGAPTIPVHSTDAAGTASSNTTLTLSLDNTAPSGGSISVPAYVTSTSVTITSANYSDGGSGLAGGSNTITRSNGQAPVAGVCPGSGYTGATTVSSPDTGVANGQCYLYTLTATDNVGNTASVATSPVLVDTAAPTDAFTLTAVSGGVFKSGATIYYKGDTAGSFKLRDTVTDGGAGPASATFGLLSGLTGASHASETVGGASPYDSSAISWATASGTGSLAAHGTDTAGNNQTDTTFTLTLDNGAPTGGSISVPAFANSTSVTITSGNYTDPGSGIGSNVLTRSNGQSPSAGVCPGSGYTGNTVVSSPDTGVANGQCYLYTLTGTDNVGNTSTVTSSPVLVDTAAPAYASAALDPAGTHVDVTFTEAVSGLDNSSTTPTSAFTVTGATISGLSYTDGTHIRLTLASRLFGDATPTVAYNPGGLTTGQKVKDSAGNLLGSISAQSISMSAVASLTQSTVTAAPGSITANGVSTSNITVQLKNAAGTNLATGGGTVSLAVGAGSLGPVTNNNDGTYTATLTSSAVAQSVNVSGQLDGSALASAAPVSYVPGAAAKLAFGVEPPASTVAGQTLTPSVTVRILDTNDNLVGSSASVTLALGANPGSSTLSGTTTRNASGGVATFDDLSLNKAATGYTLAATSGALTGATSSSYDVTSASAATIAVNGGDGQSAIVDTNVAAPPSVLVTDQFGNPVQGTSVTFAIATGGGSLTGGSATTDASGLATVGSWKLGVAAGANTLTATSAGLTGSPVTFSATGTAAATDIAVNGGDGQSATVDTNVSTAPSVLVTNALGNPVSGIAVTFAVASGGGSATGTTVNTNGSGVATVGSWKLGTGVGANTLTATSGGLTGSPVTFTATAVAGTAGSMTIDAGEGQSATVNSNVATAPSVLVTDTHGNPVAGVAVNFAIGSGGGSLTGGSATTNASGIATVGSWKLGTAAGANQLTATATGLTSVTFNATGTAAAAAIIAINAGDNQSVTVNTNVTAPSVRVTDTYGNPISGVAVTFTVAAGGGSAGGTSQTTNGSGSATVGSWKLGTTAGANTLTATSGGLTGSPVTFNATGTADVLDHLVLSPASASVSADVGSQTYSAEGRDQYENSLGDATGSTVFTVAGGSCTGAACTVTTTGSHAVTGTLLGATGNATLTITPGAPANIALQTGNGQSATVNTSVATAPSVLVTDAHGNSVTGAPVTFAVASGAGSVTSGGATTNASGIATVGSWTLGTVAGANSLTASAAGLAGSPVTFTATGTPGAAASIAVNSGNGQSATVNTNVATAPSARVTDSFGNPVTGASVTFAVASGGGSATGLSSTTNASGVATVGSWKLGTTAGANTLTATSGSLTGSPVTFTATGVHDTATTIAVNGGDSQSATVDTAVSTAPSVQVTDSFGNPVSGVSVTFAVVSGGGSATGLSQTTNGSGVATVGSWTLGTAAGANSLTATSAGLGGSPLTFNATGTAGAAATIGPNGGNAQSATVDTNVSTAPSAVVNDSFGNPVAGVSVTFAIGSGGGSLTGGSATTNASGVATVGSWKLGTTAGPNTLTATSGSLTGSPVTFTATGLAGTAGSMTIDAGDGQSAVANTNLTTAPSVLVTDAHANPVSGVAVTFSIGSGGGSVTGGSATTNASGIATVGSWQLGTTAGANSLSVSATGLSSVTFNATAVADAAASIALDGGDNQTATVDTTVSTAPSVRIADQYGNPVAGVSVTFALGSGGGSLTGANATSAADGVATVGSWKLGTSAGAKTLTASSTGLAGSPITFNATAVPDSAGSMAINAGEGQSATVNTNVAAAPSVLVTDLHGNPVSGVAITFAIGSGGGSLTGGSTTTNASGVATVGSWTLGATAGANTLTVSSTGLSSVTFNATGSPAAASTIAVNTGNSQNATVNTNVPIAPSVKVTDTYGNPVSGESVTFAVASGGGSGAALSATTDAGGIATVGNWTLGTTAGANTLTASSTGLAGSPVTFNATGTPDSAATLAVNGGDNQSATVDSNVAAAPSVKATDQFGNGVPGISVTFAVAAGGGSATGTSATTDAAGVAYVGSWKLGTAAGANTLTASSAGLAGSPVSLNATGTAGTATALASDSGDGQSATVNTNVSTAPSVRVLDSFGNRVAGVSVTFAVATGGGSATGTTVNTNGSGVATVGSWKLGTTVGANTLTASSTGLSGSPVTFTATGTVGSASAIAVDGGDNQSATVDTNVSTAPSVKVTDQYGNAVAGAAVTFAVGSGGGSATGLSQTTNASGVATVGSWKLGTLAGANALNASSTGLTGSPVVINATGTAGNVDHLSLSPATTTITADQSQTYSVEGLDQFDNSLGDVTGATTLSVTGGTCLGAVCSAPATGAHTVAASFLGAVGSATLNVGAGAPTHLVFTAGGTANLALGATRGFTVAVEDAQNNIVTSDNSTSVTFARSAGPGNLTGLGAVTVSSGSASKTVTASVEGQVTLTVSATGLTSASQTFTVDPAPIAAIDNAPSDPSTSASATFDYSADDGTATFECRLDAAIYAPCPGTGSGSKSYTGLASGGHTFDVRAVSASATGPVAHAAWVVDTTSPTVSLTLPADGSYVNTPTKALAATAADTGTGVGVVDFEFSSTPGADCSTGTWTLINSDTTSTYDATWTTPADGTYALRAVAHDGAAHSSCSLVHVTVDQTAPTATLASPAANVRGAITLHATGVADATSGLNSVSFERAPSGTSSWSFVGNGVAQGGGAYDATFDTTSVTDATYDFRLSVTDVAGNLTQQVVGGVRVDNTPPSSTINALAANVRQTITLGSTASDGGSGVASTGYQISPAGAATWTSVPASFDTTTKADGDYDLRSIATDNVGNVGYSTPVTTKIDNTPPAATLDAIARYARGTLTLGSSTSDAGSGLATVRYELSAHSANSWSTVASPFDTATQADGDYDFRVVAIDNAGNRTDSPAQLVTIDNTAPSAQLDDPASSAIKRGTITLASTLSDATSGIATFGYRVAPAGTPEATPCDTWGTAAPASFDTTTLADGLYDFRVDAIDRSGNGFCSPINTSVRIDNTAPVTTDNAPAGPQNSDVTVTLFATDGGSGVTSTHYTVDGGPQLSGTSVVIPAAGNDGTHTIAYSSTDAAGNQESTHTAQVHIDTTAPTGGSGNGGNAVRGNFVLTDSPTDTIASVEFQYRTGTSGPWTSIGTDTDDSDGWHVTWDTTGVTDGTYHLQMIETDNADNPTTTPLADTVVDNTAPASASVNVGGCGAQCSGTSVTLSGSADASVSGIGAMDFQVKGSGASSFTTVATQTSGFSFSWNSTTVPDGPTEIRIAVTDEAGNGPTYSPVTTVAVDNNAPTVTLTAPSAASGTVSLGATGSADIASVAYAISPSGAGTWTTLGTANAPSPFTFAWASGAQADGAYDLRVTATDGGGNQGSDIKPVTIDNTGPTGALTQPAAGATVGGSSVGLASTSSDTGTGVASVVYQYRAAGPGAFTDITGSTWDATTVPSGPYELRAKLTDNAGNVATTAVRLVTVDSTPPTLSLASLGTLLSGNLTIDAAVSGASQATLQVRAAGGSWVTVGGSSAAPFQISFDSSSIADGVYDVREAAVDAFGNQASDTRAGITFDNTAPELTASTPDDGALLPNGSTISALSLTASEPLQSVTNVKVDGQPVLAAPVVTGATVDVPLDAPVADGLHTFTGRLTDAAGKSASFRINTTILPPPGSSTQPPVVAKNARPNSQTVLTSADGNTTVFVPAGAYDVPFGQEGDFLVLGLGPQVASIAPMPDMTMTSSIVDITMDWNSNGDPLHVFRLPLAITMSDPTGGLAIPATFQNGAWRLIPMLSSPVLPAGQQDGFYRDSTGVHVLTTHLTLFTLVRDVQLPATPSAFSGVVAADGLTLRWSPGPDGSRIQKFLLYVDGQPYRYLGATEFETKLGAFSADDTRSFAIAAINTSGVSSIPTTPLQAVPTIAGQNVDDAIATLAARGFTAGRLIPVASGEPAGTVVGPTGVQLLPAGSIVDLQVSSASVPRQSQFVLSIAVQKRVRMTNRALPVRILATAPAQISATLGDVNYRRIQRWSFPAGAGASVHTLRLAQRLKPGTYTLYWLGRTGGGGTYRTSQKIRVITAVAKAHTAVPAQIILTVSEGTKSAERALQSTGQTIEATPEHSFDVASTRDASVVIVDADRYGVKLVQDLHTVFPTTAIVALSKNKVTLATLARRGAIALPSSTPAAKIAALVRRLAKR